MHTTGKANRCACTHVPHTPAHQTYVGAGHRHHDMLMLKAKLINKHCLQTTSTRIELARGLTRRRVEHDLYLNRVVHSLQCNRPESWNIYLNCVINPLQSAVQRTRLLGVVKYNNWLYSCIARPNELATHAMQSAIRLNYRFIFTGRTISPTSVL